VADADDFPEASTQAAAQAERWETDRQKFEHTRLERVQASARVWLGVLTTLLGLLGSVVLFKGGDLITGVTASGLFQAILIVLVSMVFVVTVLAVIFGGQATWGGLAYAATPAARPADPGRSGVGRGSASPGLSACGPSRRQSAAGQPRNLGGRYTGTGAWPAPSAAGSTYTRPGSRA
jgi:hypothetical protein